MTVLRYGNECVNKTKLTIDTCPSHSNMKLGIRKLELLTWGYVVKIVTVTNRCVVQ
jgi:hypothetical protein